MQQACAGLGCLLCPLLLPACTEPASTSSSPPPPESPELRQLNEIPLEQLRVGLKGFPGDWRGDSDRARGLDPPPVAKPVPPEAKRIPLVPPKQLALGDMPLRDTIASRRSHHDFSNAPLGLDELSFLLWSTQGVTRTDRDEAGEIVHQYRAAPSAGGRYPLETYLVVNRVDGLPPGLYRYLPADHQLVALRESPGIGAEIETACFGQPVVRQAAAVFVWAAVPYRTEWKYTYISHRMIAMEAGHVCENLYLAAESINAGAGALASYHQPSLDTLLGVDGTEEFAIYMAVVGKVTGEKDQ